MSSSRDHAQSVTDGQGNPALAASGAEWTEEQFEALICLHMLKPGHVLTEAECWAIEYTRLQADAVENNAVDAFDDGRKHGILSVVGKTEAAMFEEIGRLKSELAVERALNRYQRAADAQDASDGAGNCTASTLGNSGRPA